MKKFALIAAIALLGAAVSGCVSDRRPYDGGYDVGSAYGYGAGRHFGNRHYARTGSHGHRTIRRGSHSHRGGHGWNRN